MGQMERLLAGVSVILVFLYVLLRAIYVPTFHDEAATFFHYIVTGKFLPFQAHWDANNHILNSGLAYVSYRVFGAEPLWIRLPNVLSFLVYGYFAARITSELKNELLRWLALIAIITAAFPLEFFSLARGYAMSLAFLMAALFYGFQYLKSQKLKHLLFLWLWLWLAVLASLTIINTYIIFLGITFLSLFKVREKQWLHSLVWVLFGVVFFALVSVYAFELKERGLLYTGLADGFIGVTVQSLVRYQLHIESNLVATVLTVIGTLCSVYLVFQLVLKRAGWTATRLAAILLFFNAIGSVLLNFLFGMNFPENRVGMYFIPLFLITFSGALDEMTQTSKRIKYVGLSLLFFPVHLAVNLNLNTTILWPKWHASDDIYDKVLQYQRAQNQTLLLSADYLNELGWAYYNIQNDAELQLLQRDPVPDTLADLIIARPFDFEFSTIPYDTMFVDHSNGIYLLQRRETIKWSEPENMELKQNSINGTDEFYELLNGPVAELPGKSGYIELLATLKTDPLMCDGQLILASYVNDATDTYNSIPMHWIRPIWNGDSLHIKRTFHFSEDATGYKLYFWNVSRQQLNMDVSAVKFSTPE